jgi:hypothetical protein
MNETKKKKKNIAERSNAVQTKKQELAIVQKDGKEFVELDNQNLLEIIKKGAQRFVKVAGVLVLFNLFMSCVSTQSPNRYDEPDFDHLMNGNGKKNESTIDVISIGGSLSSQVSNPNPRNRIVSETLQENTGKIAAQITVRNDVVRELNAIASTARGLLTKFNNVGGLLPASRLTPNNNSDEANRTAFVYACEEILVAILDTATTSQLNADRTGFRNGRNQAIEGRNEYYKSERITPNWIDGLDYTSGLFFDIVTNDAELNLTDAKLKEFKENIAVLHMFARLPTSELFQGKALDAIKSISTELSDGHDIDYNTMHSLIELMSVILTEIEKGKALEKQNIHVKGIHSPVPQMESHSSGGESSNNNGGGKTPGGDTPGGGNPPTPPSQPTPTPTPGGEGYGLGGRS